MRRVAVSVAATILLSGAVVGVDIGRDHNKFAAAFTTSASAQANACAFPTAPAATPEQTAWQLFVAANCTGDSGKLVWEEWVEQLALYPACPNCAEIASVRQSPKRLHGSPLAAMLHGTANAAAPALAPNSECGTMNGPPQNVIAQVICEEARLNPEAAVFVTGNGYQIRAGQIAAAQNNTDIEFPAAAIEVKVDWIPASDFSQTTTFNCTNPPKDLHVEMIDGTCYVLAGMHISSKLLKNWLWATFEPQSMLTNPLRCITFGNCNDPWGSNPAVSSGGAGGVTQLTQPLNELMTAAKLSKEFFNYRLDGVQVDFGTKDAPTLLGNSIIEGENVGMQPGSPSCITCHSESSIAKNGQDFPLRPMVGPQYHVPAGSIARDFVWSLGLACPGAISPQSCE